MYDSGNRTRELFHFVDQQLLSNAHVGMYVCSRDNEASLRHVRTELKRHQGLQFAKFVVVTKNDTSKPAFTSDQLHQLSEDFDVEVQHVYNDVPFDGKHIPDDKWHTLNVLSKLFVGSHSRVIGTSASATAANTTRL
jgi:hypothetical protein